MARFRLRYWVLLLLMIMSIGGVVWWQNNNKLEELKKKVETAENQIGLDSARVLTEAFSKKRSLRVATLTGEVFAVSTDPGWIDLFTTKTEAKFPYSVDYFVDLMGLDKASYRWNAPTRTMTVRIPDVVPAKPNIDGTRAQYKTEGIWVTRGAGHRMTVKVANYALVVAKKSAAKPDYLNRARENAREAIEGLVNAPLRAANLGQVNIVVRFPWEQFDENNGVPVRWNESRSLGEIYNTTSPRP